MPQAVQKVPCPTCQELIAISLAEGKQIRGVEDGHSDAHGAINQLCTNCLDQIHILTE